MGNGTGAELPLEGRRLAPEPTLKPYAPSPSSYWVGNRPVERGGRGRGSGGSGGHDSEMWASSFRILASLRALRAPERER